MGQDVAFARTAYLPLQSSRTLGWDWKDGPALAEDQGLVARTHMMAQNHQ